MNPYVKKVDKKKNVIIGVLSVLALGLAGGAVYGAVKLGKAWNPVKDLTTVVKGDAIDWDKIPYDRNYTILSKDDAAKTAVLDYSADMTEFVKVPETVTVSGVGYSVVEARTAFQKYNNLEGRWTGLVNPFVKGIYLSDSVTGIFPEDFAYCSNLETIRIPESVTDIKQQAFVGCSFKTFSIPDWVTNLSQYEGKGFIESNPELKNISVGNGLTALPMYFARYNPKLEKVNLSDSVVSVGDFAFFGCPSLSSVNLSNLTFVGSYAFYGTGLKDVVLPVALSAISDYSFYGVGGFADIKADKPVIGAYSFDSELPIFFDAYKDNVTWATLATERTKADKKVYYKGQWDLKDGVPTPNGKKAEALPASSAAASSAAASSSKAA